MSFPSNKPRIVAIIQARMGSTRLPGKTLADIIGEPMLWHVINRLRQVHLLDEVIVATSKALSDDAIEDFCRNEGLRCFRGSVSDVLDRYYHAAEQSKSDVIVRITADCPMLDPAVVDQVVQFYLNNGYDYVSNVHPPTFPDGLDTEVFSFDVLERTWREAKRLSEREHVTSFIWNHPEKFRLGNVAFKENLSYMRWTVDEERDLEFVRAVYACFDSSVFGMTEILELLKQKPELMKINSNIARNEGYLKSLREDKIVK